MAAHPRGDLLGGEPTQRADLGQPGDLVPRHPAVPLHEPPDGRVQQRIALGVPLGTPDSGPCRRGRTGVRVEQLSAALGVRLDQQRDQCPVPRVVALALPERPHLGHAGGDGPVVETVVEIPAER